MAIYYPRAFDQASKSSMSNEVELVPVPHNDAWNFACNAVVVGNIVIMNEGCEETAKTLDRLGFVVKFVDMSEFIKSGGSAKCCTLLL